MRTVAKFLGAALLSLSLAAPARATLYLACGEDSCFAPTGTGAVTNTNASTFRSGWAREALDVHNNNSAADPPVDFWHSPTFSSVSSLWIHGVIFTTNTGTSVANVQGLRVYSPDGVARILLRQTAIPRSFPILTNSGSTATCATMWPSAWVSIIAWVRRWRAPKPELVSMRSWIALRRSSRARQPPSGRR